MTIAVDWDVKPQTKQAKIKLACSADIAMSRHA